MNLIIGTSVLGAALCYSLLKGSCLKKSKHNSNECLTKINSAECLKKINKVKVALKALENSAQFRIDKNLTNAPLQASRDYFIRTLYKLEAGEKVPLPALYHATKLDRCLEILNPIKKDEAPQLKVNAGLCFATANETAFGNVTFAVSAETFEKIHTNAVPHEGSQWLYVHDNIPINPTTVAYLVANNRHRYAPTSISEIQMLAKTSNFNVEIVDEDIDCTIRRYLKIAKYVIDLFEFNRRCSSPKEGWK